MKIKDNKGYVGIDVSISILILLIIIPVLTGMIYNVTTTRNDISRKSEAINIAINSIEAIKGLGIEKATDTNALNEIQNTYSGIIDESQSTLTLEKNKNTYVIQVHIQDYSKTTGGQGAVEGRVKIATVTVNFKSDSVELSTVIS